MVHCSATPEGRDHGAADIRKWHLARGFSDIGYHYVIRLDGRVEVGRAEWAVGAHCKEGGMNRRSIGVCYVGGMDKEMKRAKDTRTPEQKKALVDLVRSLQERYSIPGSRVFGHRDFAAKACPSFDVKDLLKIAGVVLALLVCGGCARKIYLPVENVTATHDTVFVVKWSERAAYDRDTVMITVRGDTLVKDVVRWRERVSLRRDTVYCASRDTVKVKESVAIEAGTVVKNKWSRRVGIILAVAAVVLVAFVWKRFRSK